MWTPSTDANITELGTVAKFIPKGKLKFTPNTLAKYKAGKIKALSMLLFNAKGESCTMPLSKRASVTIWNALENGVEKKTCLAAITKLEIIDIEDENGGLLTVISAPRGKGGDEEEFAVEDAKKVKDAEFSDLIDAAL